MLKLFWALNEKIWMEEENSSSATARWAWCLRRERDHHKITQVPATSLGDLTITMQGTLAPLGLPLWTLVVRAMARMSRGQLEHRGPYSPGGQEWLLIGGDVWTTGLVSLATGSSKGSDFNQCETYKTHFCSQRVPSRKFKRPQRKTLISSWRFWTIVMRSQPPPDLCGAFKCWTPQISPTHLLIWQGWMYSLPQHGRHPPLEVLAAFQGGKERSDFI